MGADVFKGLARGLTADVVGAPVDIATQLMNLGLAGYGYAGNKLGLLKPEQMPSLIERPVGGSDWFAGDSRSPLADTGSAEYFAGRATGNILPLLMGLAKQVPLPRKGQVNTFIGPSARTFPHAAKREAEILAQRGVDPFQIWQKTGLFQGKDGGWRSEISDIPLSFRNPSLEYTQVTPQIFRRVPSKELRPYMENRRTSELFGQIQHPELQKAYPALGQIKLRLQKNDPMFLHDSEGGYTPSEPPKIEVSANTEEEVASVLGHELQHGVQALENWAPGGNPNGVRLSLYSGLAKDTPEYTALRLRELADAFKGDPAGYAGIYRASPDSVAIARAKSKQEIQDMLDARLGISGEADFRLYERLAGEAEARNVQSRLRMTDRDRQNTPPWQTMDVPFSQQLVLPRE